MQATMIPRTGDAITCRALTRPPPTAPVREADGAACTEQAESQRRHPAASPSSMRMSADTVASKVPDSVASKVPAVTLGFWIIKIAATTLGETGGDTLSMTFDLGYLVS